MTKQIEYFLDCSSPWTFISFKGITDLQKTKSFEIIWKPILVGGIFNSINPSVYESRKNPVKEKLDYSQKDMIDWEQTRGIKINWPDKFPINSVKAMRGAFYFLDKNQDIETYLEAIFKAYWTDGKDISDENCLIKIISEFEFSSEKFIEYEGGEFDLELFKPETKTRLINNTQELIDRGGFGSPTFFLDKTDMYFGNDRLQLIEKLL